MPFSLVFIDFKLRECKFHDFRFLMRHFKIFGNFGLKFYKFTATILQRNTVRSSEQNTVCTRTLETASTRAQDFRFETVSKKSRNDLETETETETVGSETETETETSKNLSRDVSRPRQCLETIQLWW